MLSSEAKPYKDAQSALSDHLSKLSYKPTSIFLSDLSNERLTAYLAQKPAALVGVGSDAAVYLHDKVPAPQPVLYCMVADSDGLGLNRGRAIQGVTIDVPLKDQFALIAEALPRARTLGLIYHSGSERGAKLVKAVQAALPGGWQVEAVDLKKHDSASKAIEELLKKKVDVIWTAPDAEVYNAATVRTLLLEALRQKVPVFGFSKSFVKAGALLGVGIEPEAQGEQAAQILVRLTVADAKPFPLKPDASHVEAPRFEISINEVVAEKLSVNLPESVLSRASSGRKGE
ncbi:MAG: hypothetical protein HY291_21990 [Planctomycetes bacterium]|nr:hypothetical protein [Planctomycetota bacterium]